VIKIKVYKEKQFLIFDFEDGKKIKYDFKTKEAIGIKNNTVKNLKNQLRGYTLETIYECCEDKNYGRFLKFIKKEEIYEICNIGSILERVPKYSRYEQIFSSGIKNVSSMFSHTINDIPKGLIKLMSTKEILLNDDILKFYNTNPNAFQTAYNLHYLGLTDMDIYYILSYSRNFGDWETLDTQSYFNRLIEEYKYTAKSLLLYLDELKTLEAIEDVRFLIREIYDYARMMGQMSDKFDKYPRHFLTTHKIACRNYNRFKKEFDEKLFENRINKDFEFRYKNYLFIYPKSIQDIKDESVQQNNCISSYIDKVIEGNCHILFLRLSDSPDKSLVTMEVQNNKIVVALGKFNYKISENERQAVEAWNKKFNNREKINYVA